MLKKSRVKNQIKTNQTPTLFQTLSSIGNEKNTTIIFPVPIDILGHFMKGQKATKGESRGSRKSRSRPSGLDLHTPTARPGTDQTLLQGDSPRCTYLHAPKAIPNQTTIYRLMVFKARDHIYGAILTLFDQTSCF